MAPRETIYGGRKIRRSNGHDVDEGTAIVQPKMVSRTDDSSEYFHYQGGVHYRVFPLFGRRMPTPASIHRRNSYVSSSSAYRSAQAVEARFADGSRALEMKEPYTPVMKARFEDAYRVDPTVRRTINIIAKFTLGRRVKTVINLLPEYLAKRAAGQADKGEEKELENELHSDDAKKLRNDIENVNRRVRFHEKLKSAVIQSRIGGRSALLKEGTDADGFPMDLKVLNWRKLGKVFVDPNTWALKGVEYEDRKKDDPLLAEDIIYITNHDFHASPDTLYHGLSDIEPVVHISECNRLLDEEDFKEANRTMWAHHGLIKFPPNITDDEIEEFLAGFNPGTWNGTSQDVMVETHNLNINMNELVHERNENDKRIIRGMGVPAFLVGFEEVSNRATTVAVLHAWRESELHDYRTWLQDQLEPQWFDALTNISLPGTVDEDGKPSERKFKAMVEFEDITYESNKEKVEAMLPLYQAGLVSQEKVLKVLDFYDELERLATEREEERKARIKELEDVARANKPEPLFQQPFGGGGPFGQRPPSQRQPNFDKSRARATGQRPIQGRAPKGQGDEGMTVKQKAASEQEGEEYEQASSVILPDVEFSDLQKKMMEQEHDLKMRLLNKRLALMDDLESKIGKIEF